MTQAIKTEEPSINEVLTRIHRVINDDNAAEKPKPVSAAPPQSKTVSYSVSPTANVPAGQQPGTPKTIAGSLPYPEVQGELISNETKVTINSAFNSLAQTVLRHNSQTLENLLGEILRPILKAWLENNLPGIVERMVRAEIEQVSKPLTSTKA